jgi:hypothetical protein
LPGIYLSLPAGSHAAGVFECLREAFGVELLQNRLEVERLLQVLLGFLSIRGKERVSNLDY